MFGTKGQNFQNFMIVFVFFTELMCFQSIFNLLKKSCRWQFFIFIQNVNFLFSTFLENLPFLNLVVPSISIPTSDQL